MFAKVWMGGGGHQGGGRGLSTLLGPQGPGGSFQAAVAVWLLQ